METNEQEILESSVDVTSFWYALCLEAIIRNSRAPPRVEEKETLQGVFTTNYGLNSRYNTPKLWNSLTDEILSASNIKTFIKQIRNKIFVEEIILTCYLKLSPVLR